MSITSSQRIIRIEPTPFATLNLKVKMAKNKVDKLGQPLKTQNRDGSYRVSKELVDTANLVQYPGTIKYLRAAACKDGLATGLNVVVDNPYKDLDYYTTDWGERVLKGKPKVLLQHILEYKHGVKLGHYTNALTDKVYTKQELNDAPFFHTGKAKLPLYGNVFFLNLGNPFHELMYYVAKANLIVANSFEELQNGLNRDALYYIVDEEEAANVKTVKNKKVNEAIAIIEKLEKKSGELVRFAKALGVTDPISNDKQAYEVLERYFRKDTISYENFMFVWRLYKTPINKDQFEAAVLLYDAIQAGVITHQNGMYYWQKPSTENTSSELLRFMSKDKIISELFINPAASDDLEVITLLVKDYQKYNI